MSRSMDEDCTGHDREVSGTCGYAEGSNGGPFDADAEEEDILNRRRGRKKRKFVIGSESECEEDVETARDGTVWKKMKPGRSSGRVPIYNPFGRSSGPTGYSAGNIITGRAESAFSLIIDRGMIEKLRGYAELQALRLMEPEWTLSTAKFYAFIGLLFARGAYGLKDTDLTYLWDEKLGPSFFSATTSRNDFEKIMRFIPFDDGSRRGGGSRDDMFPSVYEFWCRFIENSRRCYNPGACLSVDEQLIPARGRHRVSQRIPNKPYKFDTRFWLVSDACSKYIVNGIPCLGSEDGGEEPVPRGESVVLKLAEPFTGQGRNITTDESFTSASLANKLLEMGTTLVGAIRRNKKELPESARLRGCSMARLSTMLYESKDFILSVYKARNNKKLLVLSSMHSSVKIDKSPNRVPETVTFYESTKFGAEATDKMAERFSVKWRWPRWPLHVFFNILDLAGINAWILYREATGEYVSRQKFLFQLAEELWTGYQNERQLGAGNPSGMTVNAAQTFPVRKACQIRFCNANKTGKACVKCLRYACDRCAAENAVICKNCGGDE